MCRSDLALLPDRDADVAHVVTVVKGPQRNGVFAIAGHGKIDRVSLSWTIGDAVIGKDLVPGAAIHTHISALDAARGILDIEHCAHVVADNLGRHRHTHSWRRVVYVHRLADTLARKRIARWIVEDV